MQDGEESDLGAEMPYTLNERQGGGPFLRLAFLKILPVGSVGANHTSQRLQSCRKRLSAETM